MSSVINSLVILVAFASHLLAISLLGVMREAYKSSIVPFPSGALSALLDGRWIVPLVTLLVFGALFIFAGKGREEKDDMRFRLLVTGSLTSVLYLAAIGAVVLMSFVWNGMPDVPKAFQR